MICRHLVVVANSIQYFTKFYNKRYSSLLVGKMGEFDSTLFILPNITPVSKLDCQRAFDGLSENEKHYAHYMARASFDGSLIVNLQTSFESAPIFALLYKLFHAESIECLRAKAIDKCQFNDDDFQALLVYAAGLFSNSGNYKGFGDSKFIPGVEKTKLDRLIMTSSAASAIYTDLIAQRLYSIDSKVQHLALPDSGITGYHSTNITEVDTQCIDRYFKSNNVEGWNTRLCKNICDDGTIEYTIRLASIDDGEILSEKFEENTKVRLVRGDYSTLLRRVNNHLLNAKKYAANDNQKQMIDKYMEHFRTGDINAHKDGSRFWIKDKGPVVESYIGFIENYRDPVGVRAEFEGFVAAVDKETSKIFTDLVANAENLLIRLPWGRNYEMDKFLKPDFTALDIIAFGGSGVPKGINIPNYDEIRQNEGFKNVSLSNVISSLPKLKVNFLGEADEIIFKRLFKESFEVQVGLHELLGHGSGKLFQRDKDGNFNFDRNNVIDLTTGNKVESWYEPGETWSSKFGSLSSAYEECRAEAVGYFLCCYPDVLKIFGFEGDNASDIMYNNWLSQIRAGLLALEYYSVDSRKWGQAHCHARYVLLRVCLEAAGGFVTISDRIGDDNKPDLLFELDRSKIESIGMPAIGEFLKKLQVYKSTADFNNGRKLFDTYGIPDEQSLQWRDIIIARRQPRGILVQPNTFIDDKDTVHIKSYSETFEGVIESFIDRYDMESIDDLLVLSANDAQYFA